MKLNHKLYRMKFNRLKKTKALIQEMDINKIKIDSEA